MNWREFRYFRLINQFNEMCEFTLFAYILWDILEIAIILLTLQFQLVKYGAFFKVGKRRKDIRHSDLEWRRFDWFWWLYIPNESYAFYFWFWHMKDSFLINICYFPKVERWCTLDWHRQYCSCDELGIWYNFYCLWIWRKNDRSFR